MNWNKSILIKNCVAIIFSVIILSVSYRSIKNVYTKNRNNDELIYRLDKIRNEITHYTLNEKSISFISDDSSIFMKLKSNYIFSPLILSNTLNEKILLIINKNNNKPVFDSIKNRTCIYKNHLEGFNVALYKLKNDN
jgi:hypothetical protein